MTNISKYKCMCVLVTLTTVSNVYSQFHWIFWTAKALFLENLVWMLDQTKQENLLLQMIQVLSFNIDLHHDLRWNYKSVQPAWIVLSLPLFPPPSLSLPEAHTRCSWEDLERWTVADRGMHTSLSTLSSRLLVQITNHNDAKEKKHNGEPFILFISQPTSWMDSSLR